MSNNAFSTPINSSNRLNASFLRSTTSKRDSLAAELERDPQLSTAKRKQRTQAFASHMAHASLERQLLTIQTAKTELETKLRERDLEIERIRGDMQYLAEREREEREEKEKERVEREEEKRKSDSDLRALRNSYVTLQDEHAELQDAHAALSRSTAHTIAAQKSEVSTLSRQVQLLMEELGEFKRIAESRSHSIDELQSQLNELSVVQDGVDQRAADDENWAVVREELHRQANHLRTVESANAKMTAELAILRQRHANAEILKEQKRELEIKARGTEELREKVVKLEAELETARKEREDWASRQSTPVSVTKNLTELRLKHARLAEENISTVASLHRREKELAEARERVAEIEADFLKLKAELESVKGKAVRQEHRAQLAERDVGYLKAMVASFVAEEASQEGIQVDEATADRVQHLEALVTDYRQTLQKMEKEIEDLGGDPSTIGGSRPREELLTELETAVAEKTKVEEALTEAEAEVEKHLETIETLEQKLFDLGGEIGGGRHVPPGVRVLSLRENPAQQWADFSQAVLDRLKNENEALLKRLKELENSGVVSDSADREELVPRASWEAVNREKEDLEQALKQKEKRLLRLQQVFSQKSEEFKEAVASILGVKLAFYPNGQIRVTSTFDLDMQFVFRPAGKNESMRMQLMGQSEHAAGLQNLPELMRYWVEQEQCIPAFLASITLECYENSKTKDT